MLKVRHAGVLVDHVMSGLIILFCVEHELYKYEKTLAFPAITGSIDDKRYYGLDDAIFVIVANS